MYSLATLESCEYFPCLFWGLGILPLVSMELHLLSATLVLWQAKSFGVVTYRGAQILKPVNIMVLISEDGIFASGWCKFKEDFFGPFPTCYEALYAQCGYFYKAGVLGKWNDKAELQCNLCIADSNPSLGISCSMFALQPTRAPRQMRVMSLVYTSPTAAIAGVIT